MQFITNLYFWIGFNLSAAIVLRRTRIWSPFSFSQRLFPKIFDILCLKKDGKDDVYRGLRFPTLFGPANAENSSPNRRRHGNRWVHFTALDKHYSVHLTSFFSEKNEHWGSFANRFGFLLSLDHSHFFSQVLQQLSHLQILLQYVSWTNVVVAMPSHLSLGQ